MKPINPDRTILKRFGKHLKTLRESKGISNAEMARRCFMESANYTRIESGNTNPTLTTLENICKAMKIKFQDLFKGLEMNG